MEKQIELSCTGDNQSTREVGRQGLTNLESFENLLKALKF